VVSPEVELRKRNSREGKAKSPAQELLAEVDLQAKKINKKMKL
jgi:hypothetical protein